MPLISGDRVYSAGLSQALADAGAQVTFLAHEGGPDRLRASVKTSVCWEGISGGTRSYYWVALASRLPVTAAIHDTYAARQRLASLLGDGSAPFETILFDQLGAGWALRLVRRWIARRCKRDASFRAPQLIYIAHNHERLVWADMARQATGSMARKLAVRNNARKVARLEAQFNRTVDRIVNITEEDARAMQADGAPHEPIVITPGYSGAVLAPREITAATPRRVVMVGSFKWAIKEENLRQFLAVADPAFARHGIRFDVIGTVPDALRRSLEPTLRATTLHGYVQDVAPLFSQSRLAVVPEMIGGGFKLKFLDYIFGGMPVVSIDTAVAGLPVDIKSSLLVASGLDGVVRSIIANIDDIETLNRLQSHALELGTRAFDWTERGERLKRIVDKSV